VIIYWGLARLAVLPGLDEIFRSNVIPGTSEPRWPQGSEEALLRVPRGATLVDMALRVEVWHKNTAVGGGDDFLGSIRYQGEDVCALFAVGSQQQDEAHKRNHHEGLLGGRPATSVAYSSDLAREPEFSERENGLVGGAIHFFTRRFALPTFRKDVPRYDTGALQVVSCRGLARTSLLHKCDPFVVLHWSSTNDAGAGDLEVCNSLSWTFCYVMKGRELRFSLCALRFLSLFSLFSPCYILHLFFFFSYFLRI
jgi:hypothetical protein